MARAQLVEFAAPMEGLAQFLEECDSDRVVEGALARLRGPESARELLTAAALAVSRSSELPPHHHGGPVHPVSGIHAVHHLATRLPAERASMPVIQNAALASKHIAMPGLGPTVMAEVEPASGSGPELREGFVAAMRGRQPRDAERYLLALLRDGSPDEVLDAMLSVAIPQNLMDDHYFLYTVFAARALDALGWGWAPVLLRPPVRYLARHPMMDALPGFEQDLIDEGIALYRNFDRFERLLDERNLTEAKVRLTTDGDEDEAVGRLGEEIGGSNDMAALPERLADALAEGLSLAGTAEALSIGGGRMFLRSSSGNPFDVHIHTGINARRYLLSRDGITLRHKLLALLTWSLGTEVRYLDGSYTWPLGSELAVLEALPQPDQGELLAALADGITSQPPFDLERSTIQVDHLVASEQVREIMALAQLYAERGYGPAPFFALMAELVCRDEQSEMHAYKLQQAAFEEYLTTRPAHRWVHLVSAAKHAAIVVTMTPQTVWPELDAALRCQRN